MVLEAPGRLVEREVADPVAAAGEVVIEVSACGVCRTDLQIYQGDLEMRRRPVIPGHQVVGRIAGTGERVGVAWLHGADGTCPACRRGLENLCPNAEFTGWTADGGYAELIAARRDYVFALPERVHRPRGRAAAVRRHHRLPLAAPGRGRAAAGAWACTASAPPPTSRSRWRCTGAARWRCSRARSASASWRARLGAAWTGGYDDPPPWPLDGAVTFAPVGSVVVAALRALAPGATVAVNAIHLDEMPAFSYDLLWQERCIRSVANFTRRDATEFLALAGEIPIRAQVQEFPLAAAGEALDRLAAGEISGVGGADGR